MAHQDIPLTTESTSWIKKQDAGTTSDYTVTDDVYCLSTAVSWSQGQSTSHLQLSNTVAVLMQGVTKTVQV